MNEQVKYLTPKETQAFFSWYVDIDPLKGQKE